MPQGVQFHLIVMVAGTAVFGVNTSFPLVEKGPIFQINFTFSDAEFYEDYNGMKIAT